MASTIQIKRGTGSAIPTGLADGELAINLDNRRLYFGSGSTSVNDFTFGEITAEKYIVSSSVLYVTTSFSSGSTEFGDTADDTHTFTGNITASGNISSSGTITTSDLTVNTLSNTNPILGGFNDDNDRFFEIRSKGGVGINHYSGIKLKHSTEGFGFTIQSQDGISGIHGLNILRHKTNDFGGTSAFLINRDTDAIGILNTSPTASLDITGDLRVSTNITASGNISSSGTVTANAFVGDITGDLTGNADTATTLTAGPQTIDGDVTIGANGAGHDLLVYGDTSLANMKWDSTYDFLKFTDAAKIVFGTGAQAPDFDSSIQADGSNLVIYNDTGNVQIGDTVEITGDLNVSGDLSIGNDAEITSVGSMVFRIDSDNDESNQSFLWKDDSDDTIAELDENGEFTVYGGALGDPKITLHQTGQNVTYGPPLLDFYREDTLVDNADIGHISFIAKDSADNDQTYAKIIGSSEESGTGTEGGKMLLQVATHDGEVQTGLLIEDGDAEDEVDVTIGNTTTSLTTVAGNLSIGNSITSNITSSGNISSSGEIEANTFKAAGNVDFNGDLDVDGTTNLDAVDIDGNVQLDGTLTVGTSGTGHDVTLFGDTNGRYLEWDQSADQLEVRGAVTFGAAGSNFGEVEFWGQTYGRFAKWEPDHNRFYFTDNTKITFGSPATDGAFDSSIYADGSNLVITNTVGNIQIGDTIELTGEMTASGNISSSGTIVASNISSSGDVQYSGALNGKQREVYFNNFEDKIGTSKVYIPLITTSEQSSPVVEEACFLAPCDGRIVSVTVRPHIISAGSDCTVTVDISTMGLNLNSTTTSFTAEESKNHTMQGADDYHAFHYVFDNAKHFESGELVALGIQSDVAPDSGPYTMYWYVSTVVEYDWNNQGLTAHQEYDSAP